MSFRYSFVATVEIPVLDVNGNQVNDDNGVPSVTKSNFDCDFQTNNKSITYNKNGTLTPVSYILIVPNGRAGNVVTGSIITCNGQKGIVAQMPIRGKFNTVIYVG